MLLLKLISVINAHNENENVCGTDLQQWNCKIKTIIKIKFGELSATNTIPQVGETMMDNIT